MLGQMSRSVAPSPTLDMAGAIRVSIEHVATAVVMATGVSRPHEGPCMVLLGSQPGPEARTVLIGGVRALVWPLIGRHQQP